MWLHEEEIEGVLITEQEILSTYTFYNICTKSNLYVLEMDTEKQLTEMTYPSQHSSRIPAWLGYYLLNCFLFLGGWCIAWVDPGIFVSLKCGLASTFRPKI